MWYKYTTILRERSEKTFVFSIVSWWNSNGYISFICTYNLCHNNIQGYADVLKLEMKSSIDV